MALRVSYPDIEIRAKEAEANDKLEQAAKLYEQGLKEKPLNEFFYDRLMIIYRKLKRHKDELRIINEGIKRFEEANKQRAQKLGKNKTTITRLSNALLKASGLVDKKGKPVYEPGPIEKWKKRKLVVEKKIKSGK